MAQNNLLQKDDFTENERKYIENFKAIGASIPSREITIFRHEIRTRNDLLNTILWKKKDYPGFYLASTANYTNEKMIKFGKWQQLYDDSSYAWWKLSTEKQFSNKLTSFINEYLPLLQSSFEIQQEPTSDVNESFIRHYNASIELLLAGPPHANQHTIDTQLANEWVEAHRTPERKRLARLLLDKTIYISHSELLKEIEKSVNLVQAKLIPGRKTILLTGTIDKSNYYISLLFYHFCQKAGLKIDIIKMYLDEVVAANIIDIDEMAYSGTQTAGTLAKVYKWLVNKMIQNLTEKNCQETTLKSFCQSRNFYPMSLFEMILHKAGVNYILLRVFCSENGEKKLLRIPHNEYNNPLKLPSHLVIGRKIQSPNTLFGKKDATKLAVLYGANPGYPASTLYFNHKVANLPSTFLFPYAYGVVPNAPLTMEYWTSDPKNKKEYENALKNLVTPTNTDDVEFKPFIQYCAPGTRLLPTSRKNLLSYEPPGPRQFSESEPELPQEYRCPYAWYKRINYETGTYDPLPLPNLPPLPYGPTETNFMGGRRTRREKRSRQTRKHRK